MEQMRSRNAQMAVAGMLQSLYAGGEHTEDDQLLLDHPVLYTFEEPRERLIFWPGIRRNPAQELSQALTSLAQAEEHMEPAAKSITDGSDGFLFSTPRLLVQAHATDAGKINLHAVVADTNPFVGAFGQIGLQMSILIELLAHAAKKQVGELTIQHQRVALPKQVVEQLLRPSIEHIPEDPYRSIKARKIDSPLGINDLLNNPEETMGKSMWLRHVAGPLLVAGKAETPAEAIVLAKKIKADDWRRSMTEWCEAVQQAEAFKAAQEAQAEGAAGGEG